MLDALRLGAHQLLSMRVPSHAAISTTVDLVHLRTGLGGGGLRQRGAPRGLRARPRRVDRAGRPEPADVADPARRDRVQPPDAGSSTCCATPCGEAELDRPARRPTTCAPAVTLVARPGRSTRDELPGEPTPYSPYGVVLAGGDPGAVPAVAEGRAGVQDEGSQLVATVLADAPLGGPGPALARPVRRTRRQVRAARRSRGRARGRPARQRVPACTAPAWCARALRGADGVAGIVTADGTRPPYRRRQLRPGAGRRTVHGARRAPPPAGGAVAPQARRPGHARDAAADPDRAPPSTWCGRAGCSSTRPARRSSETATVVSAIAAVPHDVVLEDATPLLSQVPDCAGPAPGHPAAVAAPARHRRDVHGVVPPVDVVD